MRRACGEPNELGLGLTRVRRTCGARPPNELGLAARGSWIVDHRTERVVHVAGVCVLFAYTKVHGLRNVRPLVGVTPVRSSAAELTGMPVSPLVAWQVPGDGGQRGLRHLQGRQPVHTRRRAVRVAHGHVAATRRGQEHLALCRRRPEASRFERCGAPPVLPPAQLLCARASRVNGQGPEPQHLDGLPGLPRAPALVVEAGPGWVVRRARIHGSGSRLAATICRRRHRPGRHPPARPCRPVLARAGPC